MAYTNYIIIDFDGTLIDVSKRDYAIYIDTINYFDENAFKYDFECYWDLRRKQTHVQQYLINSNIKIKDFVNKRFELSESSKYEHLSPLFSNVHNTLQILSSKYKLALITSRYNNEQFLNEIKFHNLINYFSIIENTNGNCKINYFKKIPNVLFVVGDTENDIFPANELKINSIAVCTGIRTQEFLQNLSPNFIVEHFSEITNIVN